MFFVIGCNEFNMFSAWMQCQYSKILGYIYSIIICIGHIHICTNKFEIYELCMYAYSITCVTKSRENTASTHLLIFHDHETSFQNILPIQYIPSCSWPSCISCNKHSNPLTFIHTCN